MGLLSCEVVINGTQGFRRSRRLFGVFCRSLLGRRGEETALHRCQLFFEEAELHLRIDGLAAETGVLTPEFGVFFLEFDDGFFKQNSDLLEGLGIVDFLQLCHAEYSHYLRVVSSI